MNGIAGTFIKQLAIQQRPHTTAVMAPTTKPLTVHVGGHHHGCAVVGGGRGGHHGSVVDRVVVVHLL